MKRRALLAALVSGTAGIAGCGGRGSGGGAGGRTTFGVPPDEDAETTTTATTTTATTTTTTTVRGVDPVVDTVADVTPPRTAVRSVRSTLSGERRLVVSHVSGAPPPETTVTLAFSGVPGAGSPARVWIALRNDADRERTLPFGPTPPFSGYEGQSAGAFGSELLLVPADDRGYAQPGVVPDGPEDGCWRAASVFAITDVRTKLALPPGEAVVGEYALLAPHERTGCLPEHRVFVFDDRALDLQIGVSVWDPAVATPGESRFDRAVPDLPDDAATAWYHGAAGTEVYLEPGAERVELPQGNVNYLLKNFSTNTYRIDDAGWRLYKLVDGRWFRVLPWDAVETPRTVPPGGQARYILSVDNRIGYARNEITSGIGGGLYALRYGSTPLTPDLGSDPVRIEGPAPGESGRPEEPEGMPPGPRQGRAALLRVVGDPVGVVPDVHPDLVDRDGDRVSVTLGDGGEAGFVLRRADPDREAPGGDPVRVIAEQANQTAALRNTLGFFEADTQRVRLEAQPAVVHRPAERFGDGQYPLVLSHGGETFLGRVEGV